MLSDEQMFVKNQEAIKSHKIALLVRRALFNQATAKIKPAALRPNLLNKPSSLRGGDAFPVEPTLDLYYPNYDTFGDDQDCSK